jgi:hypothetical protein
LASLKFSSMCTCMYNCIAASNAPTGLADTTKKIASTEPTVALSLPPPLLTSCCCPPHQHHKLAIAGALWRASSPPALCQ